jgi:hypothetical protein
MESTDANEDLHLRDATLIVGPAVDWPSAEKAIGRSEHVVFLSLVAAIKARDVLGHPGEVIDITGQHSEVEQLAWDWTIDLVAHIREHARWLSKDTLEFARRGLLLNVFMPLAAARVRANAVRVALPQQTVLSGIGVGALEALELGLGDAAGERAKAAEMPGCVAHVPGSRTAPLTRLVRMAVRSFTGEISERRRLRRLHRRTRVAGDRAMRRGPAVGILLGAPIHMTLLESSINALHARGWRSVAVVQNPIPELEDSVNRLCSESVDFHTYLAESAMADHTMSQIVGRRLRGWRWRHIEGLIRTWAGTVGLELHAERVALGFQTQYESTVALMRAHSAWLAAHRPNIVLTVNEIAPRVETVVPVSRKLGIPTVDVQHGAMMLTPLNADFRFDALCVFGEAYAENLNRLGTSPERIRVTGSPFTDRELGTLASKRPSPASEGQRPPCDHPRGFVVLFAGGYAWDRVSDTSLYETLKMVLEYSERNQDCQIILKLHPIGKGSELGYEAALAEHPDVPIRIVREGSLHDWIGGIDCVATHGSTVAIEAASYRKPTILLSPRGSEDLLPLVSEGVALRATDAEQFADCVERLRKGDAIPEQAFEAFDRRYAFRRDGLAGARIADVCEELAHGYRQL